MGKSPSWDLVPIYPGFDSNEYKTHFKLYLSGMDQLFQQVNNSKTDLDVVSWTISYIQNYNQVADLYENLSEYAYAIYAADTNNERATRELNRLEESSVRLKTITTQFRNHLAKVSSQISNSVVRATISAQIGGPVDLFLDEQLMLQKRQMSAAEEELAADLSRAGGSAWTRLQEAVSSNISALWTSEPEVTKTVTELRALAFSPDREVRKKAFVLELKTWKRAEIPIAFALNGVKGFTISLDERRNYQDMIERPLLQSRISRNTLESLLGTMKKSLPLFQRYLRAKARFLNIDTLAFFDLFAPVGQTGQTWSYQRACSFITEHLGSFSPQVGAFAAEAVKRRWIDAEPKKGKVGGAFCTSFPIAGESRILCNFDGSFSALSTIAHELGHAYHHQVLKNATHIQRDYPMTLAETASIFFQTLVFHAALQKAQGLEKAHIIEEFLQDSTQVIVDILSRYYFEETIFIARKKGDISPAKLCDAMVDAQRKTYGSALDSDYLHPYMWAVKSHYYAQDLPFYNFPYAFGLLFGLALFNRFQQEGNAFVDSYIDILKSTGTASANEITKAAGFDIEQNDFWESGIKTIEQYVSQFENLIG